MAQNLLIMKLSYTELRIYHLPGIVLVVSDTKVIQIHFLVSKNVGHFLSDLMGK